MIVLCAVYFIRRVVYDGCGYTHPSGWKQASISNYKSLIIKKNWEIKVKNKNELNKASFVIKNKKNDSIAVGWFIEVKEDSFDCFMTNKKRNYKRKIENRTIQIFEDDSKTIACNDTNDVYSVKSNIVINGNKESNYIVWAKEADLKYKNKTYGIVFVFLSDLVDKQTITSFTKNVYNDEYDLFFF